MLERYDTAGREAVRSGKVRASGEMRIISAILSSSFVALLVGGSAIGRKNVSSVISFDALQKQDYNTAYGIWMHDPEWQQHPQQACRNIPFNDFYRDWGPGGEWGLIKTLQSLWGKHVPEGEIQRSGCGCRGE